MGHIFHDGINGILSPLFLLALILLAALGIKVGLLCTRLCRIRNLLSRFYRIGNLYRLNSAAL